MTLYGNVWGNFDLKPYKQMNDFIKSLKMTNLKSIQVFTKALCFSVRLLHFLIISMCTLHVLNDRKKKRRKLFTS